MYLAGNDLYYIRTSTDMTDDYGVMLTCSNKYIVWSLKLGHCSRAVLSQIRNCGGLKDLADSKNLLWIS